MQLAAPSTLAAPPCPRTHAARLLTPCSPLPLPVAAWSGKLQTCVRLVDAILRQRVLDNDKVVVVGDRLNVLRRIRSYVVSEHGTGLDVTLTGETDVDERMPAITRCRHAHAVRAT